LTDTDGQRLDISDALGTNPSTRSAAEKAVEHKAGLINALSPRGYREIQFRRRRAAPWGLTVLKELSTLSEARRERAYLDEVLFAG
jgi:hypothetical protein